MIYIEENKTKKLPGVTSLFISFDYNKQIVDAIKSCVTSFNYDSKEKIWEVGICNLASIIDSVCDLDDITIKLKKDKVDKQTVFELLPHKTKPFDYQIDGIQYGLNHNKWLLLDAPGLGKTLTCICLAEELKKREGIQHCLIICGINTLKTNWQKEIAKHSKLSSIVLGQRTTSKGTVVTESVDYRLDQLNHVIKEFFVITNIETLRDDRIVKAIQSGKNKFDMVVVDEVHTCKSHTSQQGKNLLKLTKAKYQVAMTGTLLLNNPLDAYVPLKWIGVEKASYTNFRYYYCSYGGPFNNILCGFKNIDALKYQLDTCSLRRTKDLLNLPPKITINEYVDMNDAQQKFYNDITQGIIDEVDKVHMSPSSILGMVARLRQATACPQFLTSSNIESSKVKRACDLAEQIIANGNKVVIFSTFKETVYNLARELSHYKPLVNTGDIPDEEISRNVDIFQTQDNPVFLATWQKCGTGLTLTAANYVIFIDTPWTFGAYEQAQDRCYRIGTKDSVTIYNLICKDTIDERVLEIVNDKSAISDYVVDDKISDSSIESLRKWILELQ